MRVTLAVSLLTLVAAALAAQPASAQSAHSSVYLSLMGEPFIAPAGQSPLALWVAKADTDRSGSVSLAELTVDADRFFKTLDVDGDGRVGGYEMTRYEEEIAPARLRAAAGARPVGSGSKDRGGNAVGDLSGPANPRRGLAGLPGGMTGPQLSVSGGGLSGMSYGGSSVPQPVAMTDVDMSGSVTVDEFSRAAARRFAMYDVNKNGVLEVAELSRGKR
ncbi:MAG: hypothetical protein M3438_03840 [Pseudomonadota bacterium]|nr:hypothetical protein [Pseudomonadota bacterium]